MLKDKRVLVVDDDVHLASLLVEIFSREGVLLTTAHHGKEGLEKALEGEFDLVLLDVMLPGQDGYHIANELKTKLGADCPKILIMTCRDLLREGHLALMAGAHQTIQKPFEASEIVEKVRQMLG